MKMENNFGQPNEKENMVEKNPYETFKNMVRGAVAGLAALSVVMTSEVEARLTEATDGKTSVVEQTGVQRETVYTKETFIKEFENRVRKIVLMAEEAQKFIEQIEPLLAKIENIDTDNMSEIQKDELFGQMLTLQSKVIDKYNEILKYASELPNFVAVNGSVLPPNEHIIMLRDTQKLLKTIIDTATKFK